MKAQKRQFTTIAQAQSLLHIGMPADSADCFRANKPGGEDNPEDVIFILRGGETFSDRMSAIRESFPNISSKAFIPCWSAGRLIDIWLQVCNEGFEVYSPCLLPDVLVEVFAEYDRDVFAEYGQHIDFSKLDERL